MATPLPLIARARTHAERVALLAPEGTFSYADLLDSSARVASHLLRGRQDLNGARVAYLVPPGFRWAALQWGTWRAGGVAVPLALGQPPRELAYVVSDSGAEVVVAAAELAPSRQPVADELGVRFAVADDLLEGSVQEDALPSVPSDRGAMILYTSGTTGRPKGVLTTHANLEAQVRSLVDAWQWRADDHVLLVLPLHHVHGVLNVVMCALWSGARCSVHARFDAPLAWEEIASGGLTLFMAVPTIYQRLLAAWDDADADTRARWASGAQKLRLFVSGSAALPVQVLEKWESITGHRLLERYGMTEIGMALSNPLVGERMPGRVGSPLPGVQVRLVDEHGNSVPEGTSGEVQVHGATVFREYWQRPAETHAAFTDDGWFRTGDVAVCEAGSYRILGRASVDIVKTGGEKVSALEIEEVLRDHPAIADCAVVGVPDPDWGERLSAAVVLGSDAPALTLDALWAWARDRLAPWKLPRALRLVDALPKNVIGKVDKKTVRTLFD